MTFHTFLKINFWILLDHSSCSCFFFTRDCLWRSNNFHCNQSSKSIYNTLFYSWNIFCVRILLYRLYHIENFIIIPSILVGEISQKESVLTPLINIRFPSYLNSLSQTYLRDVFLVFSKVIQPTSMD